MGSLFMKSRVFGASRRLALVVLALAAAPALAQSELTPGTYLLEGGTYTMSAEMVDGTLVVHEPNKDSPYTRQADGSYQFYNPNTDATYGIRVIDARTIEAFKPGVAGNVPSRLVLMSSAVSSGEEVRSDQSDRWDQLAQQYLERASTDPNNSASWTACGAVAMKRSVSAQAEADEYAAQMASMLRQLDASGSPCPEVIAF
jgi:hypothetical protein